MSLIKPFRGLRPLPEHAADVAAPPYDVLNTAEARQRAAGKPWSFLHISKPEIDLPEGTDPYAAEVYAKGAENLQREIDEGILMRDAQQPRQYQQIREQRDEYDHQGDSPKMNSWSETAERQNHHAANNYQTGQGDLRTNFCDGTLYRKCSVRRTCQSPLRRNQQMRRVVNDNTKGNRGHHNRTRIQTNAK